MGQILFSISFYVCMVMIVGHEVASMGHVRTHDSIFMDSVVDYEKEPDGLLVKNDHEDTDESLLKNDHEDSDGSMFKNDREDTGGLLLKNDHEDSDGSLYKDDHEDSDGSLYKDDHEEDSDESLFEDDREEDSDESLFKEDHEEVDNEAANSDDCKEGDILQKKLFCHYNSDDKTQSGLLKSLDSCLCTHLIYSSTSGIGHIHDLNVDNFRRAINLKTKNRNLKLLFEMQIFKFLLEDNANTTKEMAVLMDMLSDFVFNGWLDGLSLQFVPLENISDSKQALNLLFTVIEFFRHIAAVSDRPKLILSLSLPQNYETFFDKDAINYLNQFIDYFVLPTLRPTHLEKPGTEGLFEYSPDMSKTEVIVHTLIHTGVSKDKLIISIPMFGMAYVAKNTNDSNRRSNSRETILTYPQVCNIISASSWNVINTNGCCSTYVTNEVFWITYSNQINIQAEVTYAILRRLGGVSLTKINDDDYKGVCQQGNFPLLTKASDVLRKKHVEVVKDANDLLIHEESKLLKVFEPLTSEDISPYNCKRNGYYRDRSNCSRFYQCAKQMPIGSKSRFAIFLFECPPGLAFDEEFQICNFQSWSLSCEVFNEISPVPTNTFTCPSPGYHKDPEHCKWFYYCSSFGGKLKAYEFRCPNSDLAFDAEKMLCNWKNLVPGCEGDGLSYTPHKKTNTHIESARTAKSLNIDYKIDQKIPLLLIYGGQQQQNSQRRFETPITENTYRSRVQYINNDGVADFPYATNANNENPNQLKTNIDMDTPIAQARNHRRQQWGQDKRFEIPSSEIKQRNDQAPIIDTKPQDDKRMRHILNGEVVELPHEIKINNESSNLFETSKEIRTAIDQERNNHRGQWSQGRRFEISSPEVTQRRNDQASIIDTKQQDDKRIHYMHNGEIIDLPYAININNKDSKTFDTNVEVHAYITQPRTNQGQHWDRERRFEIPSSEIAQRRKDKESVNETRQRDAKLIQELNTGEVSLPYVTNTNSKDPKTFETNEGIFTSIGQVPNNQRKQWGRGLRIPDLDINRRKKEQISATDVNERDNEQGHNIRVSEIADLLYITDINEDPKEFATSGQVLGYRGQQSDNKEKIRSSHLETTERKKEQITATDAKERDNKQSHYINKDEIAGLLYVKDINKDPRTFETNEKILGNQRQQWGNRQKSGPFYLETIDGKKEQIAATDAKERDNKRLHYIDEDEIAGLLYVTDINKSTITFERNEQVLRDQKQKRGKSVGPSDLEIIERRKEYISDIDVKELDNKQEHYSNNGRLPEPLRNIDIRNHDSKSVDTGKAINTPYLSDTHQQGTLRNKPNQFSNKRTGNGRSDNAHQNEDWTKVSEFSSFSVNHPGSTSLNKDDTSISRSLGKSYGNGEARVRCSKMETYQALANNNIADKVQNEHPLGCVSEVSVTINAPKNMSGIQRVMTRSTLQDRNRTYGRSLTLDSKDLLDIPFVNTYEEDNTAFIKTGITASSNNPVVLLVKATSNMNARNSSGNSYGLFRRQPSITNPDTSFNRVPTRKAAETDYNVPGVGKSSPVNESTVNYVSSRATFDYLNNSKIQTTNDDPSTFHQINPNFMQKLSTRSDEWDSPLSNQNDQRYQKPIAREPNTVSSIDNIEMAKQVTGRYTISENDENNHFSEKVTLPENNRQFRGLLLDVDINGGQRMSPGVLYVVEPNRWQKQPIPHVEIISLKDEDIPFDSNSKIAGDGKNDFTSPFTNENNIGANQTRPSNVNSPPNINSRVEYYVDFSSTTEEAMTAKTFRTHNTSKPAFVTQSPDVMGDLEQTDKFTTQSETEPDGIYDSKYTIQSSQAGGNDLGRHSGNINFQNHSYATASSKNTTNLHSRNEQGLLRKTLQNPDSLTEQAHTTVHPKRNRFTSIRKQLLNQNPNADFIIASHNNDGQNLKQDMGNHNVKIPIRYTQPNTKVQISRSPVTSNSKSTITDRTTTRSTELDEKLNIGIVDTKSDAVVEEINKIKERLALQTLERIPVTTHKPPININRKYVEKELRDTYFPSLDSDLLQRQWFVLPSNSRMDRQTSTSRSNSRMPKRIDLQADKDNGAIEDAKQGNSAFHSNSYVEPRQGQNLFRWNVPFLNDKKRIVAPEVACTREGLFYDPNDCSKFYECYWDKWLEKFTIHMFSCPVTLVFDERISGCVYQDDQTPCIRS